MNPQESMLLKAVAYKPNDVMRELLSPLINMGTGWFETALATRVFEWLADMSLKGKAISWLALIASLRLSSEEQAILKALWDSGKASLTDYRPVAESMKKSSVIRLADKAITDYRGRVGKTPDYVHDHISALSVSLLYISEGARGYDPTPSTHKNDLRMKHIGSFGDTTLDDVFDGGAMNYGTYLWVAPTKHGKSTMVRTIAARSVMAGIPVAFIVNEMTAGQTYHGVFNAINSMCAGQISGQEIDAMMDAQMGIYEKVYRYEMVEQILNWSRPKLAVVDSLDNLTFPTVVANERNMDEKHSERARGFLDMSRRHELMLHIPSNASEGNQKSLRDDPRSVNSVMGFGSSWYQSKFDFSYGIARDKTYPDQAIVKRTANRLSGRQGEVWGFRYDPVGQCYYGMGRA